MSNNQSRRKFIRNSALFSGTAPFILPSGIWGAATKPNDRIAMGFIGMGKQNNSVMGNFLQYNNVQVVAVCDVDTNRRDHAQKKANDYYSAKPDRGSADVAAYNEYEKIIERDDIDAVCIATPDHWHAAITLAALRAGKDVYCEKPLTHNIAEAKEVIRVTKETGRVLQTGSMQRSWTEFRTACELVRNGVIGKLSHVTTSFGDPGVPCNLEKEPAEPGLDWDRWLGAAPKREYSSVLSPRGMHNHYPAWRRYRAFGGGGVTDIGAHHLDIMQWGLGMDGSGPVKITPPTSEGAKRGVVLTYANGIPVTHKDGWSIHFYGSDGEVRVGRRKFELVMGGKTFSKFEKREDGGSLERALVLADREYLGDSANRLYNSQNHLENFLDCVVSRKKPVADEVIGGGTAICCHLMNLAYYHHQEMSWNPSQNDFIEGTGNAAWLTRDYRAPYGLGG